MNFLSWIARVVLPARVVDRPKAKEKGHQDPPPLGPLANLRRLAPVSFNWGFDRGLPIDRYYIERFLAASATDVRGRVLEVKSNVYTRTFGGSRVISSDVLNLREGNPDATIVGDLTKLDHIPAHSFDCIILTQTLQLVFDVRAALKTVCRILRPDGTLLLTVPGISKIAVDEGEGWEDCWRFTSFSTRRLLIEVFHGSNVIVESRGNVLASIAFLHGFAAGELTEEELEHQDTEFQMLITARAVKS